MRTETVPSEYVGALLADERSLTLVRIDPKDPWEAFRRLRRMVRRLPEPPKDLSFYETDTPIENEARVISLDSRRRAG
jgi:hypothetical protein